MMKKTMRRILCFVLAFAMISAMTLNGAFAADSFFKVKASKLVLRAEPTTSSKKIETLKTNAVLLRLDTTETKANGYTWYHVRVLDSGNEGYVAAKYLSTTKAPEGYYDDVNKEETNYGRLKVTAKLLNMRKEASSSSDVVLILEEGTILLKTAADTVRAEDTDWYAVKVEKTGETGYIMAAYAEVYTEDSDNKDNETGSDDNTGENTPAVQYCSITANTLNVREKPTTSSKKVDTLKKGAKVIRLDDSETKANGYVWAHVKVVETGKEGYLVAKYLKVEDTPFIPDTPVVPSEPVASAGAISVFARFATSVSGNSSIIRLYFAVSFSASFCL